MPFSASELERLGVRRISLGGTLARVAWTGVIRAAQEITGGGTFTKLGGAIANTELNAFFSDDMKRRPPKS
jgi:2-methylisocitrate lyase-like PEP mutase family enzyme